MSTVEQALLSSSTFGGSAGTTLATDWQYDARLEGLILITDVESIAASATLTITLEAGKTGAPGASAQARLPAYTILATSALAASQIAIMKVFPGASAVPNEVANDILPPRWRVVASLSASTADPHDFTVDAYKILGD
jgi:hypothetical protein